MGTGRKVVLFVDDMPLLLSEIKRNPEGKIVSGWVENGQWFMALTGGILLACYDKRRVNDPVRRIDVGKSKFVEVDVTGINGGYNEVIEQARCLLRERG